VDADRSGVGFGDMDAKQWLAAYADNLGVAPPDGR
jgi:hypothetical protein